MKSLLLLVLISANCFAGIDASNITSEGVIVNIGEKKLKLKNSHGEKANK